MTFNSFHDLTHLYFVTASVIEWKHLFKNPKYVKFILDSLVWMQKQKRIFLFAFVIVPSHLHVILKPEKETISNILQQFDSFTAHKILKELKVDEQQNLLNTFKEHKRDARHEHSIWQDIQAKNIYSEDVLW